MSSGLNAGSPFAVLCHLGEQSRVHPPNASSNRIFYGPLISTTALSRNLRPAANEFIQVPKSLWNFPYQFVPLSKKASPLIWQSSDIRVFSVYVYQPVSPLWSASGSPASDSAYSGSGSETTSSQRSNSAYSPGIGAELSPLKSQSFELDQLSQVDTMVSNGSWYEPPQPQEWISLLNKDRMGV